MTLMTTEELKKLILPSSLVKAELYTETPGYRLRHAGYNLYDLIGQIIETHSGSIAHSTLIDNMNGTYTFISGANPNVLIDTRAPSNPITVIGITPSGITNEQQAIDYLFKFTADSFDLLGVSWTPTPYSPSAVVTLGTFTGWTISDLSSIKGALQQLENSAQDAIHLVDNGLTKTVGTGAGVLQSKIQLGGTLIQSTVISTASNGFAISDAPNRLSINSNTLSGYAYGGFNPSVFYSGTDPSSRAIAGIQSDGGFFVPYMYAEDLINTRFKLIELQPNLIQVDSINSATHKTNTTWRNTGIINTVSYGVGYIESAYTVLNDTYFRIGSVNTILPATNPYYDFPLVDGLDGQGLITDGSGQLAWRYVRRREIAYLNEFDSNTNVVNRNGLAFTIIPPDLDGYILSEFDWSVFSTAVGTFDIELERNGVLVPGANISVIASAQNGNVSFTPITVSTYDRLRVIISNSAGSTPKGLTITLTLNK